MTCNININSKNFEATSLVENDPQLKHCLLIPSIAGVSKFFSGNYTQYVTFVITVMLKYFLFIYLNGRVRGEKESENAHLSRGQEFGKYHYFGNAIII